MIKQSLKAFLFVFTNIVLQINVFGQVESFKEPASIKNSVYVSNGEDQTVYLRKNSVAKIKILFYPKITYKLEIVPTNPELEILMELFSESKEKYFSNSDKNYIKFWHFCFQAITNGILEISSPSISKDVEQVKIKISYLQN